MHTTNGRVVLRDLADLAHFAHLVVPEAATARDAQAPSGDAIGHDVPSTGGSSPVPKPDGAISEDAVTPLTTAIERLIGDLRVIAEADTRARERATSALGRYRHLERATASLAQATRSADGAVAQAGMLASSGLADEHRQQAQQIQETARSLAVTARTQLETIQRELRELSTRPDVQRLLEEERHAAELAAQDAERRRREATLRQELDRVQALLAQGNENEARRLLGHLAKEHPNSPEPASLLATLDRRICLVKEFGAEQALRQARRVVRRAPAEAVALLSALELDGVADPLVRQVYGCWLAACRRITPAGARHYSPRFRQGAVLIPGEGRWLEVMASFGLPDWTPGRRFATTVLRDTRPL